jgi:iron complex transport system ATP-binding protein
MTAISLKNVFFSYFNGIGLKDINLSIEEGEMVGLIGPNGSGKTTLLKLISGVLAPNDGEIYLDGTNLKKLNRKTIAQRVAVVPQQFNLPFAFTVREVVGLGRTPFLKMLADGEEEAKVVGQAMEAVEIEPLSGRLFNELSGGERQKVILAMALAQQPKLLLLDEPTAHLDINHQLEILELVRGLNPGSSKNRQIPGDEKPITTIAAMHDLNLASLYFERLILLKEGGIIADGTPQEVLTPKLLSEVFGIEVGIAPHPQTGTPQIVMQVKEH